MDAGAEDNADLAPRLLQAVGGGDGEDRHVVPRQGAAQQPLTAQYPNFKLRLLYMSLPAEAGPSGAALDGQQVLREVGVAVGVAVGQVDLHTIVSVTTLHCAVSPPCPPRGGRRG